MLDETAIGTEFDPQTVQALSLRPPVDEHAAMSAADPATPGSAVSLSFSQLPPAQTEPTEPQGALQASPAVPQAAWEVQHGYGWQGSTVRETRPLPERSRAVELVQWSTAELPDGHDLEAGGEVDRAVRLHALEMLRSRQVWGSAWQKAALRACKW